MSLDTKENGAASSAIILEQRVMDLPRVELNEHGTGTEVAFDMLSNELLLDGSARLNLATFVTTWMPGLAAVLMGETADKNMIDKDEYPQTAEIERRCVNIIGNLWNAPGDGDVTGTSTTGSSEAAMLGGLALKWRWRERMQAAGKPTDRPNLVTGVNVQVCWEKFCRYWDVEPRLAPMEGDRYHLDAQRAVELCDENTIGVVAVLGSTFDGSYEPVADICKALDDLAAGGGPDVPVHVDAASGGFIAPFVQPELMWDFRLPRVQSINASGHKYGLVYPGVGWAIWRDREALPQDLIFEVNYLGGSMPTFALNFSRPGAQVLLQYYNFLRLGRDGYRSVQRASHDVARHLADEIVKLAPFELWGDHIDIPVFAWRLKHGYTDKWDLYDLGNQLRQRGWLVPAYPMPDDLTDLTVQRVVVRNGLSMDLADALLDHITDSVRYLDDLDGPLPHEGRRTTAFHH